MYVRIQQELLNSCDFAIFCTFKKGNTHLSYPPQSEAEEAQPAVQRA